MTDPALALQDGIEQAMRTDAAILTAMGLERVRLYTMSAPVEAPYPFIVIGEDQIVDDSTDCSDSTEAFATVHVWARLEDDVAGTRRQAKQIASAVRGALQSMTVISGFDLVLSEFENTRHLTDPDGLTAHAVISYRFLLDPA